MLTLKFSIGKKKRMRDCRKLMVHDCIIVLHLILTLLSLSSYKLQWPQARLNKTNYLCYVCGAFMTIARVQIITPLLSTAYFHYFECKVGDQD